MCCLSFCFADVVFTQIIPTSLMHLRKVLGNVGLLKIALVYCFLFVLFFSESLTLCELHGFIA